MPFSVLDFNCSRSAERAFKNESMPDLNTELTVKEKLHLSLGLTWQLVSVIPYKLWMRWHPGVLIYPRAQHSVECVCIFQMFTIANTSTCTFASFSCSYLPSLEGCLHLKWLTPHSFFFLQYFSEVTNLWAKNQEPLRKTQFYYVDCKNNQWW